MDTTAKALEPGTIVRAPRYQSGKSTGIRRGIVLRTYADNGDPTSGYLVWFYTLGPAQTDGRGNNETVTLVFPREIKPVGTVDGMSMRTLVKIGKGLRNWGIGRQAWNAAYRAYVAKKRAAAQT